STTTTTTAQANGQPAQPAAQPAQPTTTVAQPMTQQGQYTTQRRGLFGRRTAQVWEPATTTQVAMQQPQPAGGQPMPAAQPIVPRPAQPVVTASGTSAPGQYVTQRRGLFGRRTAQVWEPATVVQANQQPGAQPIQPVQPAQPVVGAEVAPMPSAI